MKSRRCHPLNITPCPACREPILGAFGPDEIAVVIESRVSPVTKKVCRGACGWGAGADPLVSLEAPVVQLYPLEQGVLEMCCCQYTHACTHRPCISPFFFASAKSTKIFCHVYIVDIVASASHKILNHMIGFDSACVRSPKRSPK